MRRPVFGAVFRSAQRLCTSLLHAPGSGDRRCVKAIAEAVLAKLHHVGFTAAWLPHAGIDDLLTDESDAGRYELALAGDCRLTRRQLAIPGFAVLRRGKGAQRTFPGIVAGEREHQPDLPLAHPPHLHQSAAAVKRPIKICVGLHFPVDGNHATSYIADMGWR